MNVYMKKYSFQCCKYHNQLPENTFNKCWLTTLAFLQKSLHQCIFMFISKQYIGNIIENMATTLKDDYSCVSTDYGPPAEQILIDFLPQTEILKN